MDLPFADLGVDGPTDIVDGGVAIDAYETGLGVNLDFADVATVREVGRCRFGRADRIQADAERARHTGRSEERLGGRSEKHRTVGRTGDRQRPVVEFDVGRRRLHQVSCHLLGLVNDRVACLAQGATGQQRATSRVRAAAVGDGIGVALDVTDRLERDAEPLGDQLGERGGVTLAMRVRAGEDRRRTARVEADLHPVVEDAGELDEEHHRSSSHQTAGGRRGATRLVAAPIAIGLAAVEQADEVSAVVDEPGRGRVWQLRFGDQVAPANLGGVDAELDGGDIEQALDQERGFRATGAAVHRRRAGVREHRLGDAVERGHVVDARHETHRQHRRLSTSGDHVGTDAVTRTHAKPEDLAVAIQCELAMHGLIAAVVVAGERFGTGRHPLHRSTDATRGPQHERVFRIRVGLHAEPTADVGRDDAELRLGLMEDGTGDHLASAVGVLATRVQRVEVARRVVGTER